MSAWRVGHTHINALVQLAVRYTASARAPEDLGRMLWRENYRSTNYYYGRKDRPPTYWYVARATEPTPLEALKIVDCYTYQSCEHPGWHGSEAHALCQSLEQTVRALLGVPAPGEPPGYSAARGWGWEG